MRRLALGLPLLGAAVASAQVAAPSPPAVFERAVSVRGAGRAALTLDRGVYESARADLADLRLVDGAGRLVPFVLDRGGTLGPSEDLRAELRNAGWLSDGAASAILDFGGRTTKERLRLLLSGDNFRRRVSVEGSAEGVTWVSLVDEAWVFAVPGRAVARYETIDLPRNDFALLRVAVRPGRDGDGRVAILEARVPAGGFRSRREVSLTPRLTRVEDVGSHESWLLLDLGARHQPFRSIELDVEDAHFFREAVVEARRDAAPGQAGVPFGPQWVELGRGAVHRLEEAGRRRECLRLEVGGRERALRVRLQNRDDRPLSVRGVSLRAPVERLLFEAEPGSGYRLLCGSPALAAASFDLGRTVGDPEAWASSASEATLGPPRQRELGAAEARPWTERHPALLWAGLVAAVVVLGLLTARALRRS